MFALLEPGPGFRLEALRPEGQQIEKAFRDAVQKKTGTYPFGAHQLAGSGLWLLKLVLDKAQSDDPEKFRAAVMSLDLPVGSMINGWGVKFSEHGQNANDRVQHYMLPVAERPAGHGVARGVLDAPGQVDPARRLGPAQIGVLAQLVVATVLLGGSTP